MVNPSHFNWQVYWRSWGLQYSRKPYGGGFTFHEVYLIVGPLQMRWWED